MIGGALRRADEASCLLERFAMDEWVDNGPTIGVDVRMRSVRLAPHRITVRLQVWDSAGHDAARPDDPSSIYSGVHGVLVCYDSSDAASLKSVKRWLKNVDDYAPAGVSKLIVGLKEDAEVPTARRMS